jgi:hypothetical protein
MVDTVRTLSALLTQLFQDGQDQGITAQDMRDMILSMRPPFGGQYMEDNATGTALTLQDTWYKVAGTTSPAETGWNVDNTTSSNRLVYTGAAPRHFHIVSNLSVLCSSSNQVLEFTWFKNGSKLPGLASLKIGTGSDIRAVSVHSDAMLSQNDYVELYARNRSSAGTTLTVEDFYGFISGMIA